MKIQKNIDLLPYNTFHLSCKATYFVEINNINDLQELIPHEIFSSSPHLILGGGSNILLTNATYDWLAIKNKILWKKIREEKDTEVYIQVGSWENWNEFVLWSIEQWYTGIENLVSIPWNVGAAPMQNIWAYGVEVGEVITEVTYVALNTWKTHSISAKDCMFWYRDSIFKQTLKDTMCITHVTFCLQKYISETYIPKISYGAIQHTLQEYKHITPHLVATTIAAIRAEKLPDRTKIWTAGSFFKNPIVSNAQFEELQKNYPEIVWYPHEGQIKLSAGQLIDLSGLKWITKDTVGTYKNHALVLVHYGWGTWKDIVDLSKHIQEKVYTIFSISIDPEVNFI